MGNTLHDLLGEKPGKRTYKNTTLEQRFWSKVRKTDSCWLWTAGKFHFGHGAFCVNGKNTKAHRVAYMLEFGAIPDGMLVCHRCDNPSCVRPDHLFLGTQADNARDMVEKGRSLRGERHPLVRNPECRATGDRNGSRQKPDRLIRGEHVNTAKLTEQQVLEVRRRYQDGTASMRSLAFEFGVSRQTISAIVTNRSWRYVDG